LPLLSPLLSSEKGKVLPAAMEAVAQEPVVTDSPQQLSEQGKVASGAVAVVPDLPPLPSEQVPEQQEASAVAWELAEA